jgi:hypothetical protein
MDEVGCHSRQPIDLIPRPAIFDQNVSAINKTGFAQASAKRCHKIGPRLRRTNMEKSYHRHRRLLRARSQRPPCRAPEKRNELATPHMLPSIRGLHPTTPWLEMPRCASQRNTPAYVGSGSWSCENEI